ncbi:MAG: AAA family ATPase [Candidatus Omnitrophica bacterium]|nr:AAA family ATPase [Candidatus Omnitrophota bacterium]
MSYFKVLGFEKEPFSTSPDPEFFYLSKEHEIALTNALIELRLKRGLSVILGDVGTGKTTLSRKLVQELKEREDFIFHIILNPSFENESLFLAYLARNFEVPLPVSSSLNVLELRESIERFLFQKGVTEGRTVTLIVDEAQKLNEMSLECLRLLLNYETNKFKLLQLVLLGQVELHSKIMGIPNFFDRISFKYSLNPLDYKETKELIEFRIRQAGFKSRTHLFLDEAVKEIYQHSRGYPRQITMLCHRLLKQMVIKKKFVVDKYIVQEMVRDEVREGWFPKESLLQKSNY